jgi:hypothetical protein
LTRKAIFFCSIDNFQLLLSGVWQLRMYRFPLKFAVDSFLHFGPRILNSQIKSQILTRKLLFWTTFPNVNKRIRRLKVRKLWWPPVLKTLRFVTHDKKYKNTKNTSKYLKKTKWKWKAIYTVIINGLIWTRILRYMWVY